MIATAIAGECECVVTGDKDLLVLGSYATNAIVSPGDFWKFARQRSGR